MDRKRLPYDICGRCGDRIDYGEHCDCLMREFRAKAEYQRLICPNTDGQLKFNFESEEKAV